MKRTEQNGGLQAGEEWSADSCAGAEKSPNRPLLRCPGCARPLDSSWVFCPVCRENVEDIVRPYAGQQGEKSALQGSNASQGASEAPGTEAGPQPRAGSGRDPKDLKSRHCRRHWRLAFFLWCIVNGTVLCLYFRSFPPVTVQSPYAAFLVAAVSLLTFPAAQGLYHLLERRSLRKDLGDDRPLPKGRIRPSGLLCLAGGLLLMVLLSPPGLLPGGTQPRQTPRTLEALTYSMPSDIVYQVTTDEGELAYARAGQFTNALRMPYYYYYAEDLTSGGLSKKEAALLYTCENAVPVLEQLHASQNFAWSYIEVDGQKAIRYSFDRSINGNPGYSVGVLCYYDGYQYSALQTAQSRADQAEFEAILGTFRFGADGEAAGLSDAPGSV